MKQVYFTQFDNLNGIEIKQAINPVIEHPEQVLIKVNYLSINYKDLFIKQGLLPLINKTSQSEFVPLSDMSATVVDFGSAVTGFAKGDRVTANYFKGWLSGKPTPEYINYGYQVNGFAREYALVYAEDLVHVPTYLNDIQAATFSCAGVTAWNAVKQVDKNCEYALVQGTGGVSMFAAKFLSAMGKKIILVSSKDQSCAVIKNINPWHVINYKQTPDWGARVVEVTKGKGVGLVVDVGGASTLEQSIVCTSFGATIAAVGVLGGLNTKADTSGLIFKNLALQGIYVGSKQDLTECLAFAKLHQIAPFVDTEIFELANLQNAFNKMARAEHEGKVVVRV